MDMFAHMATFVRIVETGNLSAAAGALRRSLPGVSRQLSMLEHELGTTLVKRSTRRLQITEAGQNWYAHCVRILADVDAARASVNAGRAARGLLTVSAPVSLGLVHVVPRIPAILRHHHGLQVDLRLEDHLIEPVTAGIDVVVRAGLEPPDSTALVAQPLLTFFRAVVASPSYLLARGEPRDAAALTQHECVVQLGGAGPLSSWQLVYDGKDQSIQVRGALRVSSPFARPRSPAWASLSCPNGWWPATSPRGACAAFLPPIPAARLPPGRCTAPSCDVLRVFVLSLMRFRSVESHRRHVAACAP
jgi:DNA-binding transcriptional LysR family regulator